MNPERWKQIDELVDEALELPEDGRIFFVTVKCGEDKDLKDQVLKLLAAQQDSDKFMQNSAMNLMAKAIAHDDPTVFQNSLYNRTIGNYKIERVLGAGGMGEVYLAHDRKLDRKVALKILPKEFHADDERVKRFEIEARAIAVLNHPNIVTIYDFGHIENVNYIATEFVEGKTVRDIISKKPPIKEILSIILQATDALSAAHNAGIIHRDIKPENIMIRPDGYIKILDFGLAKLTESENKKSGTFDGTMKGAIIGTPAYMSPEQASGDILDHRTDLWSIGLVLYELIAGKNPFKKESRQMTIQAVLTEDPPLVSSFNEEIPAELDQILVKALEKDADLSYQTASDLRADLKRVKREIDSSPSWSSRSNQISIAAKIAKKPGKVFSYAIASVLLLIIGSGSWFLISHFYLTGNSAPDWSHATSLQLTELSGTEYFPSLAPDGKSFVYSSDADGDYDIYWQRIGGKKLDNLTMDSAATDSQPAFSPDGEFIAFRSEREQKGIYVMEATGENTRRVCDFGYHPAWSPDGKEIVVSTTERDLPNVRNSTPSQLWIVNVESGEKRMLIEMDAMQPAWSPNGKRIAFWFMKPGGSKREVATVAVEGGEPLIVTKDGTTNWNPVWSPQDNFLYFASDRGGNINFWRVAINENSGEVLSEPEAVPTPSKYSRHLGFSADGKKLIYVQSNFKANIQAIGFNAAAEKTVGEPFWITSGDRQVSRSELSPDGKQFVVRLTRRAQEDIFLISREGIERDLTNDAAFDRYPRWSPDSRKIAFISDRSGNHEIWTIDADGSNLKQITSGNTKGITFPHWSPDGKQMIYRLNQQIFIFDPNKPWNEQKPSALPAPPDGASFVAWDWSPDGKLLIGTFSDGIKGMGTFSFETNKYEKVSDTEEIPMWLADSRRISYARGGKPYIFDIITKKETELSVAQADEIATAGVSRDNSLLYFTVASKESDIWLLDASAENE